VAMSRHVLAIALVTSCLFVTAAHACLEKVTFYNKTGEFANDLHIHFNRGVNITNPGVFGPDDAENGLNIHNLDGNVNFGGVNNNDSTKISVTTPGGVQCDNIQILEWWWTVSHQRIGDVHEGMPKASLKVGNGTSSGTGAIRIRIDAIDH